MSQNQSLVKKELFSAAVKNTLNEIGSFSFEMVNNKLLQEFRCSMPDCLEHPDYLKKVLNQIFGYADVAVIEKLKENLAKSSSEQVMNEFIQVLAK